MPANIFPVSQISNLSGSNELVHSPEFSLGSTPERELSFDCLMFRDTTNDL